jgi:hypothetical protein
MSLFDVLRYPISLPPTEEELDALPVKLFHSWTDNVECHWYTVDKDSAQSPRWVSGWMNRNWPSLAPTRLSTEIEADVYLLRRLISEWQE